MTSNPFISRLAILSIPTLALTACDLSPEGLAGGRAKERSHVSASDIAFETRSRSVCISNSRPRVEIPRISRIDFSILTSSPDPTPSVSPEPSATPVAEGTQPLFGNAKCPSLNDIRLIRGTVEGDPTFPLLLDVRSNSDGIWATPRVIYRNWLGHHLSDSQTYEYECELRSNGFGTRIGKRVDNFACRPNPFEGQFKRDRNRGEHPKVWTRVELDIPGCGTIHIEERLSDIPCDPAAISMDLELNLPAFSAQR